MNQKFVCKALGCLSLSLLSCGVYASGFQLNELSTAQQGSTLAGAATAKNDVSTMVVNPATLASLKPGTSQLYIGGSYIAPRISYSNATGSIGEAPRTGAITSESSVGKAAFVPAFYIGKSISDKTNFGLALTVPWGMGTEYDANSALNVLAIESEIKSFDITPTLSFQINPKLSLGVNIHILHIEGTLSDETTGGSDFLGTITGSGDGVGYGLGMHYQINPLTSIGLGYRSAIVANLNGTIELGTDDPTWAKIPLTLPEIANIGIRRQVNNKLTLMAQTQWTHWSTIKNLDATTGNPLAQFIPSPTHYRNTWFVSFGGLYHVNDQTDWRFGLGYDTNPTNSRDRDPRLPDSNRKILSTGFSHKINSTTTIDGAFEHLIFNHQSVNTSRTVSIITDKGSADYKGRAEIVSLSLRKVF